MTITGVVLSGVAAAANASAQSKVQSARDDAMAAERIRQKGYDQQADATNAHAQDQYQNFEAQQGDRKTQLADYYKAQTAQPVDQTGPVALPQSSSNVTVQAENTARGQAKAFTDKQGDTLAGMRSFGDLLGTLGRGTARDAITVGQIGGFKKGSSAVLPYELEAANSKGSGMKMLGDVAGGLGKIGVSAGLSTPDPLKANFVPNTASPYAYGSGGYTGMGPFKDPGLQIGGINPYSLFAR
ncbi:hypothetical protein J2Y55_001123 [Bosea sp. BE125]|uniref:hypothetical protein n=1 Tax=Bosea sp. BE125 TaxID=2817909 RepID=UPI002864A264|nr:hypothetical protein [Bosea sp. BE125]MDR6870123.1 hypothetical protein [Bosea sp. BE125]